MNDIYEKSQDKPFNEIHHSNKIHPTAIIYDNVTLGKGNIIGAYTVIGSNGEIRGVRSFDGSVNIGDGNVISEHVTIQRPFATNKTTKIGSNNLIMAHSHIGHDVVIGDNCEICSGTIIGGYAKINNEAKLKIGATIRNRVVIEDRAIVGMGSVVVTNVERGCIVMGNPSKVKK